MRILLICLLCFAMIFLKAEEVKLIPCENSLEMYEWGLEFIQHAEQSIDFAACFFGGSVLQNYMDIIEKQMQKHRLLQVHILMSPSFVEPKDRQLLDRLEKQYPRQLHITYSITDLQFTKNEMITTDNHMKMLIVDETYFTLGGTNLDDVLCSEGTTPKKRRVKDCLIGENLASGARDQDVVAKSPTLSKQLRCELHKHIALWKDYHRGNRFTSKNPESFVQRSVYKQINENKRPKIEKFDAKAISLDLEKISLIFGGPHQKSNQITKAYANLISQAKDEIVIGNLHFAPASSIFSALKNASKRGVKTTVITNGINDCSPYCNSIISWPNRIHYLPVLYGKEYKIWEKGKCKKEMQLNAQFFEYYVKDMLYHKKVMVVDGRYFVIGSYNLGMRSDNSDYEVILVIDSEEIAEFALQVLKRDMSFSKKLSSGQIRDWYFDPIVAYKATVLEQFNVFM